jgi:hypothetical protein
MHMASMNINEKANVADRVQALNVHFSDRKYTLLNLSSMEIRVCISIFVTKL